MPTQLDFFVALLLGIVPALAILWFSLSQFSYPHVDQTLFDDRKAFFALAVGMVFGVLASVLNIALGLDILLLAAVLLLEEAFKLVYLNRRGYRGRFDTTFYGVPLGAGAASTAVVASAYGGAGSLYVPESLLLLALFSVSLAIAHVDTGALIGFGASQARTWKPFVQAVAVRYAHTALLSPFILLSGQPFAVAGPWALLSVVASLGFAAVIYRYVYEELLPGTLPEDIRRKIKRERRRLQAVKD